MVKVGEELEGVQAATEVEIELTKTATVQEPEIVQSPEMSDDETIRLKQLRAKAI